MDDLRKVILPPLNRDGWPHECYVITGTIVQDDLIQKTKQERGDLHALALTVALRACHADGRPIWGKAMVSEWVDAHDCELKIWLILAAREINKTDLEREAELGNLLRWSGLGKPGL